jgi:hypothetical protein
MIEAPIERRETSDENTMGLRAHPAVAVAPSCFSSRSSLDRSLDHLFIAVLKSAPREERSA